MGNERVVRVARALADPTRLQIFRAIAGCRGICCGEVGRLLPISQATVSHHLRILHEAGLVARRRQGQFIYFRAVPSVLREYRHALARIAEADLVGRRSRVARAKRRPGAATPNRGRR